MIRQLKLQTQLLAQIALSCGIVAWLALVVNLFYSDCAGSEWDYVILSTVRSLPKSSIEKKPTKGWKRRHLGFITDTHQINVALTRAKKGLIIIGKFSLSLTSF